MHCGLTRSKPDRVAQRPFSIMSINKGSSHHSSGGPGGIQPHATISAAECSKGSYRCGFLRKRGRQERLLENLHLSRHINWRQKFVVVKDGCCYCFDDEVAKSPSQAFSLQYFYRVFRHKAERATHVFGLEPAEGKLQVFAASTEDDMKQWMMAFRQAMVEANPGESFSVSGGSWSQQSDEDPYKEIEKPVFNPPSKHADLTDGSGSGGFRNGGRLDSEDIEEDEDTNSDDSDYDQPDEDMKKPLPEKTPARRSLPLPPVPGQGADGVRKPLPLPPSKPDAPVRARRKPPEPVPEPEPEPEPEPRKPRTKHVKPVPAAKPTRRLSEKDCLFDNSDRDAAIEILKEKEALGTFLIRKSRQGDSKVLVVMTSEGVREYKIFTEGGQVTLDKKSFFTNVDELLQHYSKSPLPNRTQTLGRSYSSSS